MELQLVTFEQAKALEEIGMPQWNKEESDNSKMAYDCEGELWEIRYFDQNPQDYYTAPTLELAAKWLREEKNLLIEITRMFGKYAGRIMELHTSGERNPHIQFQGYTSYEEALSAGIDKAIEILKEK